MARVPGRGGRRRYAAKGHGGDQRRCLIGGSLVVNGLRSSRDHRTEDRQTVRSGGFCFNDSRPGFQSVWQWHLQGMDCALCD